MERRVRPRNRTRTNWIRVIPNEHQTTHTGFVTKKSRCVKKTQFVTFVNWRYVQKSQFYVTNRGMDFLDFSKLVNVAIRDKHHDSRIRRLFCHDPKHLRFVRNDSNHYATIKNRPSNKKPGYCPMLNFFLKSALHTNYSINV